MDHIGFVSLIPPIIAIILAIIFKNVIVSLFTGVFVGLLIMSNGNPITATTRTINEYITPQFTDSYNAAVIVLLLFIGGFVALVEKSGGGLALANKAAKHLNSKRKTQLSAWFGGIVIFFSDMGTPLIIGPIFEKIFDKVKLSREKLAWIIDSTSTPVAVLIPFIGWGVYIMGLIKEEFDRIGVATSEFTTFVHAIPFQFYAILSILIVPVVALTKVDFGAMSKANKRVEETGALFWPDSKPLRKPEVSQEDTKESHPLLILLPLGILFLTLFGLLLPQGFPFNPVPGSDFRVALSTGYLFASVSLIILMIFYKVRKIGRIFDIYISGMQKMMHVILILVLAWALGSLLNEMGTAAYIIELLEGNIAPWIVPMVIFAASSAMSFATGSSWGTFAIMLPLAIPMSYGLDAPLLVSIGAVLSGGIFGDHCSPISDSTILASTGAGCDHVDHVKTQLPYALINGLIALISFGIAGVTGSAYTILFSIPLMVLTFFIISNIQTKRNGVNVTQ
ncbi:Na+/H+ antiporter NhaC family protein [Pontibacillus litoralis]|uniref:Sodium/hydrogen exchanger n=1 Tax=Pontibacillus litoralis JSM 072002 TaxID=1385512 RepID=A0A0A5G8C7_9BACI|nr:Na+/H+ antiporter NhaC family protein [Pontibacillus litoralis]KGX87375.1 sodium/hydrogen exchanger [Pontibacillus litoralis JSM 072002]